VKNRDNQAQFFDKHLSKTRKIQFRILMRSDALWYSDHSSSANDQNTAIDFSPQWTQSDFIPRTNHGLLDTCIKQIIKERQRVFHTGDAQLWRQDRRRVQIKNKLRKITSILKKIHYLRKDDVCQCWHTINTMSGRGKSQPQITIERDGQLLASLSPVYTTLNFWYGTDKIGNRLPLFWLLDYLFS
jgi:hypothetical protein